MGLKAVVEDLATIDEPLRALYVQKDGKYVLDAEVDDHPAVRGLKSAHERVKEEERKAREALKKLDGVDLEKYNQMVKEAEERENAKALEKGEFEKLKTQIVEKHATELKKAEAKAETLKGSLYKRLAENEAVKEISAAEGSVKLLLPHLLDRLKPIEDEAAANPDDRYRVVVVDEKGNPQVDSKGDPLTIAALVAEFKENPEFAGAFKGSGASGSGASGNGAPGSTTAGSGVGTVRTRADLKSDAQKAAFIKKHGRQAFIDLPEK